MNVLITGGLGFIGSNLFNFMAKKYPNYELVILDSGTYAADESNIENINNAKVLKFSITERDRVFNLFDTYKFSHVIHLAAESHVDNSIKNPMEFVNTNIIGTINLLDACVKYGIELFYHISTDEVFGHLGPTGEFNEDTPYDPRSPYSASKASSDHFVRAYHHTYNLPVLISNCSNNYGTHQYPEKLIPVVINKLIRREKIPVYGNGENVRDWLHVSDHAEAIIHILEKGAYGETYCVGGNNCVSNLDLVKKICQKFDQLTGEKKSENLISFVEDRKGHDLRYAIDASKMKTDLEWSPKVSFDVAVKETVQWYIEQNKEIKNVLQSEKV